MQTTSGKIFQVTLVLALAASSAFACDFNLTQSKFGYLTRITVGKTLAMVEQASIDEMWYGFVDDGQLITEYGIAGATEPKPIENLPLESQKKIRRLSNQTIEGMNLFINKNLYGYSNANKVIAKQIDISSFKFSVEDRYNIVYANGFNFGLVHIFYLSTTNAVATVNKDCRMEIKSIGNVEPKLREYLKERMFD